MWTSDRDRSDDTNGDRGYRPGRHRPPRVVFQVAVVQTSGLEVDENLVLTLDGKSRCPRGKCGVTGSRGDDDLADVIRRARSMAGRRWMAAHSVHRVIGEPRACRW